MSRWLLMISHSTDGSGRDAVSFLFGRPKQQPDNKPLTRADCRPSRFLPLVHLPDDGNKETRSQRERETSSSNSRRQEPAGADKLFVDFLISASQLSPARRRAFHLIKIRKGPPRKNAARSDQVRASGAKSRPFKSERMRLLKRSPISHPNVLRTADE
jgi:hypothetical protein